MTSEISVPLFPINKGRRARGGDPLLAHRLLRLGMMSLHHMTKRNWAKVLRIVIVVVGACNIDFSEFQVEL